MNRFVKLGSSASVAKPDWEERIRKLIGPIDKKNSNRAAEMLCLHTLSTPAAIAHPKWQALIKEIVGMSMTYGDATEATYGERLSFKQMEEDEGSAMDFYADEHLYTFDWILTLLALPQAIAHKRWPDLVIHVCKVKDKSISYYSFGDEEIIALLSKTEAKAHNRYSELLKAARKAFPHASWSSLEKKKK